MGTGVARPRQRRSGLRWLREAPAAIIPIAIVTGALTGLGAVVFRWLIEVFTKVSTGYGEYPGAGPSLQWPQLGLWFLVVSPVVAGAVYGPLVYWLAPEARRHGAKEAEDPYAENGMGVGPRVTAVKTLGSALTMGGGGSVGREGPMVAIGSAVGSAVASALRIDTSRLRLLVACGAAAGIAAAFNAPIAGAFFAMELIVRSYAAGSFGAVVIAAWTAHLVSTTGGMPLFEIRGLDAPRWLELPVFALLGVFAGLVGLAFARAVPLVGRACDWVWRGPEWLRPAVGGVLLGGMLFVLPEMFGSGYPVIERAVAGHYELAMLALLMVAKIVATSFTLGIGGLGGVFAPTLFIGAMAGGVVGAMVPGGSSALYGLAGMAAAFAAAERAPITAIVLIFELNRDVALIPALILAVAASAGVSWLLRKKERAEPIAVMTAAGIAREVPEALPCTSSLAQAAAALARSPFDLLPVVDGDGRYLGCVTSHDVLAAHGSGVSDISGLVTQATTLSPTAELEEMLDTLAFQGGAPVLGDDGELVGWVVYEDLLSGVYPA